MGFLFYCVSSLVNYLCNTYFGDSSYKLIGYQIQFVNCFNTMSKEKQKKLLGDISPGCI